MHLATRLAVLALACTGAAAPARAQVPAEIPDARAIVAEMNRVRTDPRGYAAFLEEQLQYYRGNDRTRPGEYTLRTSEGARAVRDAITALRSQAALPALEFHEGLARAAADHVRDQGPSGATGHDGTDGSTMQGRIERYGDWQAYISENIEYGSHTARDVVMALVIDDGVPSRGHRTNILDARIRIAGAACGPHREYRVMCVVDHAGGLAPRTAR